MKFRTLLLPFAFFLFTFVSCSAPPPGKPAISLHPAEASQHAFIEVSGLSSAELASLRRAGWDGARWQTLLNVRVEPPPPETGESRVDLIPPVEGRYSAGPTAITFTPLFPFDPGRAYSVRFNPGELPTASNAAPISTVVRLPALERRPPAKVVASYPSGDVLPENTLRLYIEFSAPMGDAGALDYVRILDDRAQPVDIPFLPVQADFWNADHTRYTLFFDPGRVKLGIKPNEDLGRPLQAGHRYTLQISREWRDGQGQPLEAEYRRIFTVGPAETHALSPSAWRIDAPSPGTRDPLIVTFPAPLDHGLLARALAVQGKAGAPLEGEIGLEKADTRWVFRPRDPWEPGEHQLMAQSILEDPAGNRIGRAFEIDMTKETAKAAPETTRLTFAIGARR